MQLKINKSRTNAGVFITMTILLLSILSCKRELEEKPFSALSPDDVFVNEEGLKKAVYGVYGSWTAPGADEAFYRFTLAEAGHRYVTNAMGGGTGGVEPYYRFAQRPMDAGLAVVWKRYYTTIARANTVIENAINAVPDEAVANTYIAEARFSRAYAYFMLVRDFGGVPIIDKEIKSLENSDLIYKAKSTVEETYNFIVEDIRFAESNLPDNWEGENTGRISSGIAKAMLGKVYLHMAGKPLGKTEYFQMAADKLNEVVGTDNQEKYNFGLLDNYKDIWALQNERNREILLSFSYFTDATNVQGSIFPFRLFPRGLVNGDEQTAFGLTYDLFQLFEPQDKRRDVTLIERYVYIGTGQNDFEYGDSVLFDPEDKKYRNKRNNVIWGNPIMPNGLSYGKLARDSRPAGAPSEGYNTDMVELRFADVLLCLAEALTEAGNPGDALQHLNRVRTRAGAALYNSTGQADMRAAIRKERRLELVGEFTTVYDIRRWGTLSDEIDAMSPDQVLDNQLNPYSAKLEIYPIPQTQIDANINLIQNEGW